MKNIIELTLKIVPELFALFLLYFDNKISFNHYKIVSHETKNSFINLLEYNKIKCEDLKNDLENIRRILESNSQLYNIRSKIFIPGAICLVSLISYSADVIIDKNLILFIIILYFVIFIYDLIQFNSATRNNLRCKKNIHFLIVSLLTVSNLIIKVFL